MKTAAGETIGNALLGIKWKSIRTIQNGKAIESKIVEHEGAQYGLIKAVPDQGSVMLTAQ
jgi:phosphoribosylformylglycinamidine (FGAM) synthase PurS component